MTNEEAAMSRASLIDSRLVRWVVAIGFAFSASLASGANALDPGSKLIVQSDGPVRIQYIGGQSALFTNELFLDQRTNGPTDLFLNRDAFLLAEIDLGSFTAGTELIFRNLVQDTGDNFRSGLASRNPDSLPHAKVIELTNAELDLIESGALPVPFPLPPDLTSGAFIRAPAGLVSVVGFEDSFNYSADADFNDMIFLATNLGPTAPVPEPAAVWLFLGGLGLIALAVMRRRVTATAI